GAHVDAIGDAQADAAQVQLLLARIFVGNDRGDLGHGQRPGTLTQQTTRAEREPLGSASNGRYFGGHSTVNPVRPLRTIRWIERRSMPAARAAALTFPSWASKMAST